MYRFGDSFDTYTAASDFETKWNTRGGGGILPVISNVGRNGTNGMRLTGSGNGTAWLERVLDNQQTWIVGFGYRQSAFIGSGSIDILSVRDSGTLQWELRVVSDNTLRVTRAGTTLGTTVLALNNSVYAYIETKVKIDPTVGTVDVMINGVNRLSLTGQNTRGSANSFANAITLGNRGTNAQQVSGTQDYDDFYICDTQGSVNIDFIGDIRDEAIFPTGVGNSAMWARGGADSGANWSQVNETAPNGDTNYNFSSTINDVDTFAMANVTPTTGIVRGIQVCIYARKDDAGSRFIAPVLRIGGVDYVGSSQSISTTYAYYMFQYDVSPATGVAFTIAEVNAMEVGYKLIS